MRMDKSEEGYLLRDQFECRRKRMVQVPRVECEKLIPLGKTNAILGPLKEKLKKNESLIKAP